MIDRDSGILRIENETVTALGRANLTHWEWMKPIDHVSDANPRYSLNMKLSTGQDGGSACFLDQWSRNRFEPVGQTFLVPAARTVHFKCNSRKSSLVCCWLDPENIHRWFDGELDWTDSRLKRSLDIANPTLFGLLIRLSNELRTPRIASDTLIELIFAEIVIELARYCIGHEERVPAGTLTTWRMMRINERLAEIGARPSISELADLCSMSPRHLTRVFRKTTGHSIGTYMAHNVTNHAKQLLRTDQYINAIAKTLGFGSTSYFCNFFFRATGETPQEFRQRVTTADRKTY